MRSSQQRGNRARHSARAPFDRRSGTVPRAVVAASLLFILKLTATAHAEKGILILNVKDTKDRPIAGVRISTEGDGATGPPTDPAGKTRIRLAPQTQPGHRVTLLQHDYSPTTIIKLSADSSARVRGIVVDSRGLGLVGVRVSVAGYGVEAVVTSDGGSFDLPAHAAEGQQVYLHAEKAGFRGESLWHPAGNAPARVELAATAK